MTSDHEARVPGTAGIATLMAVGAGTLFVASAIHFGIRVPLLVETVYDPFPGAAIPEAVISAVLSVGAVAVAGWWPSTRGLAWGALAFALLGVVFGLSVTVPRGGGGDIGYHVLLLALLLFTAVRLSRASARG